MVLLLRYRTVNLRTASLDCCSCSNNTSRIEPQGKHENNPPYYCCVFVVFYVFHALHVTRNTFGRQGRIRTCDLRIRSPLLYPSELLAVLSKTLYYDFMKSNPSHLERFPDYSVPYSKLGYLTTAHIILTYARFYERWWRQDKKPATFTYEQHLEFRTKQIRKDTWYIAASKLVKYGWLTVDDNRNYRITPDGINICKRVAARNSARPDRNDRPHLSNKD